MKHTEQTHTQAHKIHKNAKLEIIIDKPKHYETKHTIEFIFGVCIVDVGPPLCVYPVKLLGENYFFLCEQLSIRYRFWMRDGGSCLFPSALGPHLGWICACCHIS